MIVTFHYTLSSPTILICIHYSIFWRVSISSYPLLLNGIFVGFLVNSSRRLFHSDPNSLPLLLPQSLLSFYFCHCELSVIFFVVSSTHLSAIVSANFLRGLISPLLCSLSASPSAKYLYENSPVIQPNISSILFRPLQPISTSEDAISHLQHLRHVQLYYLMHPRLFSAS